MKKIEKSDAWILKFQVLILLNFLKYFCFMLKIEKSKKIIFIFYKFKKKGFFKKKTINLQYFFKKALLVKLCKLDSSSFFLSSFHPLKIAHNEPDINCLLFDSNDHVVMFVIYVFSFSTFLAEWKIRHKSVSLPFQQTGKPLISSLVP